MTRKKAVRKRIERNAFRRRYREIPCETPTITIGGRALQLDPEELWFAYMPRRLRSLRRRTRKVSK